MLQANSIIAPVAGRSNVIGRTLLGDRRTPTSEILELSVYIQTSEMATQSDEGAVRNLSELQWGICIPPNT